MAHEWRWMTRKKDGDATTTRRCLKCGQKQTYTVEEFAGEKVKGFYPLIGHCKGREENKDHDVMYI